MHLNTCRYRSEILIDWIVQSTPRGGRVLDIGANDGSQCPEIAAIAAHAGFIAGVDPDVEKLNRNPLLQARYAGALEDASIPEGSFDCAYSMYVFEHVQNTRGFLRAASRALKPGGSLFFMTPNGNHYFVWLASMSARLGAQDRVLKLVRPGHVVDAYHYPAMYRLNRPSTIKKLGAECGFREFEFRYTERFEDFACYFPGPLKVLPWLWERAVESTGQEALLGNLIGRMVKAG